MGKDIFKVISCVCTCLLWSGILSAPLISIFRYRNVSLLALRYSSRYRCMCSRLSDMCPEPDNLVKNHFPHLLDVFNHLECKIKGLWTCRLIGSIMPDME